MQGLTSSTDLRQVLPVLKYAPEDLRLLPNLLEQQTLRDDDPPRSDRKHQ